MNVLERRPHALDSSVPGIVYVTDPAGQLIATINPLTRVRRSVDGRLEAVLSPQGWSLNAKMAISWPGHGKPERVVIEPIERAQNGKIRNREEGRIGQGVGGGRPRKGRG